MATFNGTSADDAFTGTAGADTITSGGGKDTLNGADGNDTIILDAVLASGSTLDGGPGSDTLVLRNFAAQPVIASHLFPLGMPASGQNLFASALASIERLRFESAAGTQISAVFGFAERAPYLSQLGPAGLSATAELIGGAGRDVVSLVAALNGGGTVNAPVFAYGDWTTPDRAYRANADTVAVVVSPLGNAAVVVNGSPHQGVQSLSVVAGQASDTLNGSNDMDYLTAGPGGDSLFGNAGDDTLAYLNSVTIQKNAQGQITGEFPLGSVALGLFDGGDGFDFLALGGVVHFQGEVAGIEGLFLAPAFTSEGPDNVATRLDPATVHVGAQTMRSLPADLLLDGIGTISVSLAADPLTLLVAPFDASAYRFDAGSQITFAISGTSFDDEITGSSGIDVIESGPGDDLLIGGPGDDAIDGSTGWDVAVFSGNRAAYAVASLDGRTVTTAGPDGEDVLRGIDVLRFDDGDYVWRDGALKRAEDAGGFRLFAGAGFRGGVGGTGTIVGTNALEHIRLYDVPGDVTFDGSFNRGYDEIRLPGFSYDYTIVRFGSLAILSRGDDDYTIPVGRNGALILFEDDVRVLRHDGSTMTIGFMSFDVTPVPVGGPNQNAMLNDVVTFAQARLFMAADSSVIVHGEYQIFGTNGAEQVTWRFGHSVFDASFNRGGDTLLIGGLAEDVSAYLTGSNIVLVWDQKGTATIPVGRAGMTLQFDAPGGGGDLRELFFDQAGGVVRIGEQPITATSFETANELSAFAGFG